MTTNKLNTARIADLHRMQPGDVEVVVRGAVGIASLEDGDVRVWNGGVDRVDNFAVSHQSAARYVVNGVFQPIRQHQQRDGSAAVFHVAEVCGVLGINERARPGGIRVLVPDRRAEQTGKREERRIGRPRGPQIVPMRSLTTSNPALCPINVVNSSAVFLNAWIWCGAKTGNGASSRQGTSSTPTYTPMELATENRLTPHSVAALSALSRAADSERRYSTGSGRLNCVAARCTIPVMSCRFPMSRKATPSVVSRGSMTTRLLGSYAKNSGSRVDRCAVSTTVSPKSRSAREREIYGAF
jgi:hypothetical protein